MRYRSASQIRLPAGGTRMDSQNRRILFLAVCFGSGFLVIAARFFQLQVLEYKTYRLLAADQHEIQAALVPKRGTIFLQDRADKTLYPVAQDRDAWQVYAAPREMKDVPATVTALAPLLDIDAVLLQDRFSRTTSSYELLSKDVPFSVIETLRNRALSGVGFVKGVTRFYPEEGLGGQVLGFVSLGDKNERVGRYGLEAFYQNTLAGEAGSLLAEKDAVGRRLAIGDLSLQPAKDGSGLILTIDRAIQYQTCQTIQDAVKRFSAESGSIVVMDAQTGAILSMCSSPDFEPSAYGKAEHLSVLNNPVTFTAFEPGSVFKAFTVAAGLEVGKITPNTTYMDSGELIIDAFPIRNSDKQAHGAQTMSQLLEKSLNTGAVFVQQLLGRDTFRDFLVRFGFGEKTGIDVPVESKGDIAALWKPGRVFAATASYGQGITATPIQLAAAYAALGNGGKLWRPYLVQDVVQPDGAREKTKPFLIRQVLTERSSRLISALLVNVVEKGHGKRAGVPGYFVAGKTGTAQIPDPRGGYLPDATIGTFAGFAPADNPRFAMVVKIARPRGVTYAESSAAPVFGELARFLLTYLQVPPDRPTPIRGASSSSSGTRSNP